MAAHGTASHGTFRHGGTVRETWEAGVVPNAKPDTVFYSSNSAGLEVDLGQKLTDLTDATTYFYETNSSRCNITSPREVTAAFMSSSGTVAGSLVGELDAGGEVFRIRYLGGPAWQVQCIQTGMTPKTIDLPGGSGTIYETLIVVQWSTRANLLTTGASDAVQHEVWIWRKDTDEREITTWTSPIATGAVRDFIVKAGNAGGADQFNGTLKWVRVGTQFHSTTEAAQDWRLTPALPTTTAETRLELPAAPFSADIFADGEFAGPGYLAAASAVKKNEFRLFAPLINEAYDEFRGSRVPLWIVRNVAQAPGLTDTSFSSYVSWNLTQARLDGTETTIIAAYVRRCMVPPGCTGAHVRVYIDYNLVGGGTSDMEITCFASSNPPNSPGAIVLTTETTGTLGAGDEERVDCGILPLDARGGLVYFFLGFSFNSGAVAVNDRFEVLEWVVNPIFEER